MKSIVPHRFQTKGNGTAIVPSSEEWENIFHAIPDMITVHDNEFNILFANKAAEETLNLPFQRRTEKLKCFKYYHGTTCPPPRCPSCECLKTGSPAIYEVFEPHLKMIIEIRAIPRLDDKENIIGIIHIARNITRKKKTEQKLRASQRELRNCFTSMIAAREKERAKIARDIHDELSQSLTTLKMDLFLLDKKIPDAQKAVRTIIHSMSNIIESTIKEIKRISADLRPKILDELGLLHTIHWQASRFQEQSGIVCSIEKNSKIGTLDNEISLALFRIFQETCTNVIRHAKATSVKVQLRRRKNAIFLKIADNGVGITDEEMKSFHSHGIVGMRERVQHYGGKFTISGRHNQGTTVRVTIPLKDSGPSIRTACKDQQR